MAHEIRKQYKFNMGLIHLNKFREEAARSHNGKSAKLIIAKIRERRQCSGASLYYSYVNVYVSFDEQ